MPRFAFDVELQELAANLDELEPALRSLADAGGAEPAAQPAAIRALLSDSRQRAKECKRAARDLPVADAQRDVRLHQVAALSTRLAAAQTSFVAALHAHAASAQLDLPRQLRTVPLPVSLSAAAAAADDEPASSEAAAVRTGPAPAALRFVASSSIAPSSSSSSLSAPSPLPLSSTSASSSSSAASTSPSPSLASSSSAAAAAAAAAPFSASSASSASSAAARSNRQTSEMHASLRRTRQAMAAELQRGAAVAEQLSASEADVDAIAEQQRAYAASLRTGRALLTRIEWHAVYDYAQLALALLVFVASVLYVLWARVLHGRRALPVGAVLGWLSFLFDAPAPLVAAPPSPSGVPLSMAAGAGVGEPAFG